MTPVFAFIAVLAALAVGLGVLRLGLLFLGHWTARNLAEQWEWDGRTALLTPGALSLVGWGSAVLLATLVAWGLS